MYRNAAVVVHDPLVVVVVAPLRILGIRREVVAEVAQLALGEVEIAALPEVAVGVLVVAVAEVDAVVHAAVIGGLVVVDVLIRGAAPDAVLTLGIVAMAHVVRVGDGSVLAAATGDAAHVLVVLDGGDAQQDDVVVVRVQVTGEGHALDEVERSVIPLLGTRAHHARDAAGVASRHTEAKTDAEVDGGLGIHVGRAVAVDDFGAGILSLHGTHDAAGEDLRVVGHAHRGAVLVLHVSGRVCAVVVLVVGHAAVLDDRVVGIADQATQVQRLSAECTDAGGGVGDHRAAAHLAVVQCGAVGVTDDHAAGHAGVGDEIDDVVRRNDAGGALRGGHVHDERVGGVAHDERAVVRGADVAIIEVDVLDHGLFRISEEAAVQIDQEILSRVGQVVQRMALAVEGAHERQIAVAAYGQLLAPRLLVTVPLILLEVDVFGKLNQIAIEVMRLGEICEVPPAGACFMGFRPFPTNGIIDLIVGRLAVRCISIHPPETGGDITGLRIRGDFLGVRIRLRIVGHIGLRSGVDGGLGGRLVRGLDDGVLVGVAYDLVVGVGDDAGERQADDQGGDDGEGGDQALHGGGHRTHQFSLPSSFLAITVWSASGQPFASIAELSLCATCTACASTVKSNCPPGPAASM